MEQQIPSQLQPPSLRGAGNADAALSRLAGQSVLVYTLLTPATGTSTAVFPRQSPGYLPRFHRA